MKKRLVCMLLAALLLCGCAAQSLPAQDDPAPVTVDVPAASGDAVAPPENTDMQDAPAGDVLTSGETLEQRLSLLMPVIDSVVRTLGIEGEYAYSADNADQVWNVLYLIGENWSGSDARITHEGDVVIVPAAAMADFAHAAYGLAALPELPAEMYAAVTYDAAADAYRLAPSDMGAAEVYLTGYCLMPDGSISARASLFVVDELLGQIDFTLVSDANTVSGYAISAAVNAGADSASWRYVAPGTEASVDLDGDGQAETVSYAVNEEDACTLTVRYGSQTFTEQHDYFFNAKLYLADLDDGDGKQELCLIGDTGSDDYDSYFYRLSGGQMLQTTLSGTPTRVDGKGKLTLQSPIDILGSWGGECDYTFDSANFTFTRASDYRLSHYLGEWADRQITLQKDGLTGVETVNGAAVVLAVGDTLLPLYSDLSSYVVCERPDGMLIRLTAAQRTGEYDWGWNIEGVYEADWFGELLYAG